MGKYFITGSQGSGKTTAIGVLQERGYTAYNTDSLPGVTRLQLRETGEFVDWPEGKVDWSTYAWNWQEPEIDQLLESDETVFLGAIVTNQAEFYHKFDERFAITLSANSLKRRLQTHEHARHRLPGEPERLLGELAFKQESFVRTGAIAIPGDGSPDMIVDQILKHTGLE